MTTALAWIGGIVGVLAIICLGVLGALYWMFSGPNSFR